MSIGGIVVLMTSTLNRVMVVELLLPALLPGILVAVHYAVQILRPRLGYGADKLGKCTPWIKLGMVILAFGSLLSTFSTTLMFESKMVGISLAFFGFMLIGLGVSAAGTSVLTLLAKKVSSVRRAAAATVLWLMMIGGFAVTALIAGQLLDPFSPERLFMVALAISLGGVILSFIAIWGIEENTKSVKYNYEKQQSKNMKATFLQTLKVIISEPKTRNFSVFVFLSMFAFSMQDLILEPFAGKVFEMSPGETTSLSGIQHSGVLFGMILVGYANNKEILGKKVNSLKLWIVSGCVLSAVSLIFLSSSAIIGEPWPLGFNVFVLGFSNGVFSIAAIAMMMQLAKEGLQGTEGTKIGLWGASQALAFGLGGFLGAASTDLLALFSTTTHSSYAIVFFVEAVLFFIAAFLAQNLDKSKMTDKLIKRTGFENDNRNFYVHDRRSI